MLNEGTYPSVLTINYLIFGDESTSGTGLRSGLDGSTDAPAVDTLFLFVTCNVVSTDGLAINLRREMSHESIISEMRKCP